MNRKLREVVNYICASDISDGLKSEWCYALEDAIERRALSQSLAEHVRAANEKLDALAVENATLLEDTPMERRDALA